MRKLKFYYFTGERWLLSLPIILSIFGLLAIFDASSVSALHDFSDRFYYLKHQSVWLVFGLILFFLFSVIDYKILKKIAFPFLVLNLSFLILVFVPGLGREIYGGKRWLQIGFGFQPAELMKFTIIIYFATLFEKKREFLPFLTVMVAVLILLILEPDLGTSVIVIATGLSLYFVAGAPLSQAVVFLISCFILSPLLILVSPYRKERLLTFFDSSFDVDKASYHVRQILIALGSGGILGRGFGQSRQKFLFLPEVTTDSIFAVIGEEFGLLGSTVLIFALFFLVCRIFRLALAVKDPFGRLLVSGFGFCIGIQTIINLGAMVALIPLTGVPLPFISYGGSSLLVSLAGMGIVYNISKSKYGR